MFERKRKDYYEYLLKEVSADVNERSMRFILKNSKNILTIWKGHPFMG